MPKDSRYDDLTAFLAARGDAMFRTAVLLAPGREAGEDLLQEALERLLRKWHTIDGDLEGYSWLPLQSSADPAVAFRQALKAGTITVAGHRILNGRATILLRVNDDSYPDNPPAEIWVDASTYTS